MSLTSFWVAAIRGLGISSFSQSWSDWWRCLGGRVTLVHVSAHELNRYTGFEWSEWSPQAKILLTIRTFNWHKLSFSTVAERAWVRRGLIWLQSLIDYGHLKMQKGGNGIIDFTYRTNQCLFWKATYVTFCLNLLEQLAFSQLTDYNKCLCDK